MIGKKQLGMGIQAGEGRALCHIPEEGTGWM